MMLGMNVRVHMADIIQIADFKGRVTKRTHNTAPILRHPSELLPLAEVIQLDEYRVSPKEIISHPSMANKRTIL